MTGTSHARRAATRLAAGAVTATLLLAGCAGEVPQPDPEPAATAPLPVLDSDRIERILDEVEETIAAADAALDPALLEGRVTGPALEMRAAEYRLVEASDGERALTPLTTASQVQAVAATDEWPRSVVVISHVPDDANLPLLLVLTQEDARSQYQLWFWTPLLPGAQTPSIANVDVGSPLLPADADGLVLTPLETVAAYAGLLDDPQSSDVFAEDPFREGYVSMIEALRETVEVAGEVDQNYVADDSTVMAMQYADGGAVVVGVIEATLTISRTVEGSSLEAGGEIALLMEDAEIDGSAAAGYLIPVAFAVPAAGSGEQIAVLGASQVLADVAVTQPEEDEDDDEGEDDAG